MENWQLKQLQGLPLEVKIEKTKQRIKEWYEYWDGNVYISFSGGKDSTVLLDLARRIYPDIKGVFVDTGLEYPEIRSFVKTKDNIEWIRPKIPFNQVIEKYGYPIISKEVSRDIGVAKNKPDGKTAEKFKKDSEYTKKYGDRWCLEEYAYLIDAPFKISNKCCNIMKKNPLKEYHNETGLRPIIATMASESVLRKKDWLEKGCNAFDNKNPSKPMSFWTEQDVLTYLKKFDIDYCLIYGDIIEQDKKLKTTGLERTGCMFCMYGIQSEKEPNRFQKMKTTHPKQYEYCINKLGLGEVLDYIGINYE
jgi:3'-phosphoadenosine 5'-phosphosulfate sulfotransferase (PAPS reductase)/FAD synthetase